MIQNWNNEEFHGDTDVGVRVVESTQGPQVVEHGWVGVGPAADQKPDLHSVVESHTSESIVNDWPVSFWVNKTAGREIIHNRNVDKFMCRADNTDNSKEVVGTAFWTKCRRRSRKIDFCQGSIKFYFQRPRVVNVGRIVLRPRGWDGSTSMSKIPVSSKCLPEVFS